MNVTSIRKALAQLDALRSTLLRALDDASPSLQPGACADPNSRTSRALVLIQAGSSIGAAARAVGISKGALRMAIKTRRLRSEPAPAVDRVTQAEELIAGGMTQREAARTVGLSAATLSIRRKAAGRPPLKRGRPFAATPNENTKSARAAALVANGSSQVEAAQHFGISRQAVSQAVAASKADAS